MKKNIYLTHNTNDSLLMNVLTVFFYVIYVITLDTQIMLLAAVNNIAAICVIVSACSTVLLNAYRFFNEYKNNKIKEKQQS